MASLKLKLVIDKRRNRVLFAEAGKDFVDFIFHILSLPVGTLTRSILSGTGPPMQGCLGRIYQSVKDIDGDYIDDTNKEFLLNSKALFRGAATLGLLPEASLPGLRDLFRCSGKEYEVFSVPKDEMRGRTPCQFCAQTNRCKRYNLSLSGGPSDLAVVLKGGDAGGYVKKCMAVYMVQDDLLVKPMSAVSVLSLMGTTDNLSNFENREVDFGPSEALKLMKASLQSKTALTDVFLGGEAKPVAVKTEPRALKFNGSC